MARPALPAHVLSTEEIAVLTRAIIGTRNLDDLASARKAFRRFLGIAENMEAERQRLRQVQIQAEGARDAYHVAKRQVGMEREAALTALRRIKSALTKGAGLPVDRQDTLNTIAKLVTDALEAARD